MYQRRISRYKSSNGFSRNPKTRILDKIFASDFKMGHKKDFAWKSGFSNPYKVKEPLGIKKKLEIMLLTVSFFGTFFLLIFHPYFHINKINITGLQRIKYDEIKGDILGIMKDKKFAVFPKTSYIFTDIDEVRDILKDKYPIESIVIKKSFPNELSVNLEEKISTIIYDNGELYNYLGLDGNIVETLGKVDENEWQEKIETSTTTLADGTIREEKHIIERIYKPNTNNISTRFGNYPIVYDARITSTTESLTPLIKPETVSGIINWFNFLNKKTDIPFSYIIIEDGMGKGLIKTKESWDLIVDLSNRFDAQIDELNLLLKEKIDRKNLNYIDLRFPDKVYWK